MRRPTALTVGAALQGLVLYEPSARASLYTAALALALRFLPEWSSEAIQLGSGRGLPGKLTLLHRRESGHLRRRSVHRDPRLRGRRWTPVTGRPCRAHRQASGPELRLPVAARNAVADVPALTLAILRATDSAACGGPTLGGRAAAVPHAHSPGPSSTVTHVAPSGQELASPCVQRISQLQNAPTSQPAMPQNSTAVRPCGHPPSHEVPGSLIEGPGATSTCRR